VANRLEPDVELEKARREACLSVCIRYLYLVLYSIQTPLFNSGPNSLSYDKRDKHAN